MRSPGSTAGPGEEVKLKISFNNITTTIHYCQEKISAGIAEDWPLWKAAWETIRGTAEGADAEPSRKR